MELTLRTLFLSFGVLGIGLALLRSKIVNVRGRLPPGPAPSFVFGNKLPAYSWRYFCELSKEYGPIITVWNGNKPLVICNSVHSASEILEKSAGITGDRPRQIVASEILSQGNRIIFAPFNNHWRRMRKALHHPLQPAQSKSFEPFQHKAALAVIRDILQVPSHFQDHITTYAATLVVYIAYGRQDKISYKDPDIEKVRLVQSRVGQALRPGAFLVETFPILRYVPGYLREQRKWQRDEIELFLGAVLDTRRRAGTDEADSSFASWLTAQQQEMKLSDDEIAYLCGSIFGAGSDTSSSAVTVVVMAAATHRDQQERVQKELDAVVGKNRVPQFSDWDALPLTQAFYLESYRWRPATPGGLPHNTTADVNFEGYLIPKGTTIFGNHWGINRDPTVYSHPEDFDMDRWLEKDINGNFTLNEKMPQPIQFGFGRRICQGLHIANRSIYINTAVMLWAFDIGKKVDPTTGMEVDIDTLRFTNAFISHPLSFEASFKARIPDLEAILKEASA